MKTLLTLFTVLILSVSYAQTGINYKAIIKDSNGNVLSSSPVTIQFIIYEGVALSNNVYQESHTINTDSNGLIIVNIGEGTSGDDFSSIAWQNDTHFLNVQVNTGSGLVDLGTTQFMTVPYAKVADVAKNVSGLVQVTENDGVDDNTGWRLKNANSDNYGPIGENAVDLSISPSTSTTKGATGEASVALGRSSTASGRFSLASGSNANATALYTTAIGSGALATENYATAIGRSVEASGFSAIALGFDATASGQNSTALGVNSTASGFKSIALGLDATASGGESITLGNDVDALSFKETVLGSGNTLYTPIGAGTWEPEDRLLTVGNGDLGRSDALIILKNGTITAPSFDISEITDDKALITKEYADENLFNSGLEQLTEGGNTGWRLIGVNPNSYGDIGDNAVDLSFNDGFSSISGATGSGAFAAGNYSRANGDNSVAIGRSSQAIGINSVAIGRSVEASGNYSVAIGSGDAFGDVSFASGQSVKAIGDNSVVFNYDNEAIGDRSVVMGSGNFTRSFAETTFGINSTNYAASSADTFVATDRLFSIGNGSSISNRNNALTILKNGDIGVNKDDPTAILDIETSDSDAIKLKTTSGNSRLILDGSSGNSTVEWRENSNFRASIGWDATNNRMFCYQGGTNVFYLNNGNLGIKDSDPTYALELPNSSVNTVGRARANAWNTYSDARVKSNGKKLDYGLEEVLQLLPKSYNQHESNFENGELILEDNPEATIGLFAQEVYKIIPEAVSKPANENEDLWSMDYEKLIPVLINAIKEQQDIIKTQNVKISSLTSIVGSKQLVVSKLENDMAELKSLVNELLDDNDVKVEQE